MKSRLPVLGIIAIGIIVFILYYSLENIPYEYNPSANRYYGMESFILLDKEEFSMPSIPGANNHNKNNKKTKTDASKDKAKSQVESNLADKKQNIVAKGKKYSEKANQIISKINSKMFGWLE